MATAQKPIDACETLPKNNIYKCAYSRVRNKKENLILNMSNEDPLQNTSSPSSAENAPELPAVFDVRLCFNLIETIKRQNLTVVIAPGELIDRPYIMLFYCRVN